MQLTETDRIFVLTGAGISAESGLATFRGSGGLWNGYRVDQVATPEAWEADPAMVWNFYSMRRRDALAAQPNPAHLALAAIEQKMGDRFYLCTQNVDDIDGSSPKINRATRLIGVGTSGSLYPAAGLVHIANQGGIPTVDVGPEEP